MIINWYEITPEGLPVPGSERIVTGKDAQEIVEIMRYETPFTAAQPLDVYMEQLLAKLDKTLPPLPSDPVVAAAEFLSRLAASGMIRFE